MNLISLKRKLYGQSTCSMSPDVAYWELCLLVTSGLPWEVAGLCDQLYML